MRHCNVMKRAYIFAIAVLFLLLCAGWTHASQVFIEPGSSQAVTGDTITIAVRIDQVTGLGGFQFGFTFDPSLIQVSAVRVDNAFDKQVSNHFDNGTGKGMVAALALVAPPVSGSVIQLAAIDFVVSKSGVSNIGLTNVVLGKIGGEEISSSSLGGSVNSGSATVINVTNTTPTPRSIIASSNVSYTLSEDAQSGVVIFERTGGATDDGSPHVYTCGGTYLSAGVHTLNTGMALMDNAFYKVTFQFRDKAGNTTSVSSAMVFFDSNYGKGSVGNVANEDGLNIVNDADVAKMQSVMGSRPGDKNWNPACDLDHNNRIDGNDLMILWTHYGEKQ